VDLAVDDESAAAREEMEDPIINDKGGGNHAITREMKTKTY
jgi:hypothetical protein